MTENKTIFIAHNWQDNTVNRQSKEMALYFSQHNKVVFLHAGRKGIEEQQINKNLQVLKWPGKRPTGVKDALFAIKLMRQNKPDIVISNFAANNIILFVSWFLGTKKRICYYHTLVSQYIADKGKIDIRQRWNIARKNFFWRKATHILAVSSAAKQDILQYYNVKEQNIYIFPNAIPNKGILNKGDVNKIGFIGRLHKSKGVDILIKAFSKLSPQMPDLKLSIAGSGDEKEHLQQQVINCGLSGKVIFEGNVPNEDICNFIAGLNFLVVPSRMDNLPTVVLEAFSTATPVIGCNTGGIPDMIEHDKTGLLFEKEDVEGLFGAMQRLLGNRVLWLQLSTNAKNRFSNKYSLENLPARFEKLLAGEK